MASTYSFCLTALHFPDISDDHSFLDLTNPNYQFLYCPSLAAAILFTILFGLATIAHITLAVHYRKPFCWVLIMGALWEFIAAITRVFSILAPTTAPVSETSFVFLVLAPLWINAFDYMVLGRMVYFFLPDRRLMGVRGERMAVYFVSSDMTYGFLFIFLTSAFERLLVGLVGKALTCELCITDRSSFS